jgi:hypothetical protein
METPDERDRKILDVETAIERGESPIEKAVDEIWNTRNWVQMSDKDTKYAFNDAFAALGGDPNDLDIMYQMKGADAVPYIEWGTSGGIAGIADIVKRAAMEVGVKAPEGAELNVRAEAETLNDNFTNLVTTQFGADFEKERDKFIFNLNYYEQQAYLETHPGFSEKLDAYSELENQFGKQNPIWAQYYNPKSTTKYYSKRGGGRRGGGGGGGSKGVVNQGGGNIIPMGFRSQGDIISILAGDKLGSGGIPKWMPSNTSPVLIARISGNVPLTPADIKYLKKLVVTNPENAEEIERFIVENSQVEATVA